MLLLFSRAALALAAVASLTFAGIDKVDRPVSGTQKGLVVAVDFPESPLNIVDSKISNFYNQPGYLEDGTNGSVRDYYTDISGGALVFSHQVIRYAAQQPVAAYYNQEHLLFLEVLQHLAGQSYDFNQLSKHTKDATLRSFTMVVRGDNFVTSYHPFSHTGPGTVEHSGFIIQNVSGTGLLLAQAAHEIGHMSFYWPDLYDYATGLPSQGIGTFCMYGSNHLMPGNPVRVNPFLLSLMGWISPVPLLGSSQLTLNAGTNSVYKIPNPAKAGEYFLLEARVKQGRSAGLPGEGLALWHVDETQWDQVWWHYDANQHNEMLPDAHYTISLVQADRAHDLEGFHNGGEQKDLFAPATGLLFSDLKGIDAHWWSGKNSGFSFGDLTRNGSQYTLNYTLSPNAAIGTFSGPQAITVSQGATASLPVNVANSGTTTLLTQAGLQSPNYTVSNSDQAGGPAFIWQSIRSPATLIDVGQNGTESKEIALPFAFPFYGKSFTSMSVFGKTTLAFGTSFINHNQAILPSVLMPPSLITPFCAFVIADPEDSVYVLSDANKVVVEWSKITQKRRPDGSSIALMTVQAVLYRSGEIRYYYNTYTPYSVESMTAGIQDETQMRGISTGSTSSAVHAGLAVVFTPKRAPVSSINETVATVNAGQTRALSLSVNAASLPVGTYMDTLLVSHNGGNLPSPIVVPVTVTVTPPSGKPDLVVTDIQWTPASPATGNQVRFSATIANQGTGPTPAGVTHGVAFSVNGAGVTYSANSTASLAPGASRTVTASGPAANGGLWTAAAGTHSVRALVDDVNRFAESNETNNTRTETLIVGSGQPDLIVTSVSWSPLNPAPGQAVTFSAVVKNQGSTATSEGIIVGASFFVNGAKVTWSNNSTASLAPGGSRTLTANGGNAGAAWNATLGSHTIRAHADDVGRIAESVETNNTRDVPVIVGVDLIVTAIGQVPANPASGQEVQFTATIKNQGTVATPAIIHGVAFKVNGTTVSWSDNTSASLAPGTSRTVSANWGPSNKATWKAVSGTHSVQAWVDDINRIPGEANEGNNTRTKSLVVP